MLQTGRRPFQHQNQDKYSAHCSLSISNSINIENLLRSKYHLSLVNIYVIFMGSLFDLTEASVICDSLFEYRG